MQEEVITTIVEQINREYAAALFYRQVYHWFDANNYPGSAAFARKEAADELTHAYRLEDYLLKRSAAVKLQSISVNTELPT